MESESTTPPATPANQSIRPPGAAEIASYIGQLCAEMGQMAGSAKLELLAYLLAMARNETETIVRRIGV